MSTVELKSAPGAGGLYFKAAIGMTPLAGTRKKELPDTVVALEPQPVDLDKLAAFGRVAEHTLTGKLPPIYFNVLSMPLQRCWRRLLLRFRSQHWQSQRPMMRSRSSRSPHE